MALKIIETNGIFIVEGILNASTARGLKNHCKLLLDTCGALCIDIQQIAFIDRNGLLTIRSLYHYASQTHTKFSVVGDGGDHDFMTELFLAA